MDALRCDTILHILIHLLAYLALAGNLMLPHTITLHIPRTSLSRVTSRSEHTANAGHIRCVKTAMLRPSGSTARHSQSPRRPGHSSTPLWGLHHDQHKHTPRPS
jgi:hypothetical protein